MSEKNNGVDPQLKHDDPGMSLLLSLLNRLFYRGHWPIIFAFATMHLTHLRGIPMPGTGARPLTTLTCLGLFCLILLCQSYQGGFRLYRVPGWYAIRYWGALILWCFISLVAVFFYGIPKSAVIRFSGYLMAFSVIYITAYAVKVYGLQKVSHWIVIGYTPFLLYGIFEVIVIYLIPQLGVVVTGIRSFFLTYPHWNAGKMSLLTAEPSFLAPQVLLLVAVLPYTEGRYRQMAWFGIGMIAVFPRSANVALALMVYLAIRFFQPTRKTMLFSLSALALFVGTFSYTSPYLNQIETVARVLAIRTDASAAYRLAEVDTTVYALQQTYGLGTGLGQYTHFMPRFFRGFISDPSTFRINDWERPLWPGGPSLRTEYQNDLIGGRALWSALLSAFADLGLIGGGLFVYFLFLCYANCQNNHERGLVVASLAMLMGGFSLIMPHLWVIMALLVAKNDPAYFQRSS